MEQSVRNKRRFAKKERENLYNLFDINKKLNENAQLQPDNCELDFCATETDAECSVVVEEDPNYSKNNLVTELGQWQMKSRTSNKNMRDLLIILKNNNIEVPISPASLVPKVNIPQTISVQPGNYMHFGIKHNLEKAAHVIYEYCEIICDINIDGLPLFKSSNSQLWPILVKVVNIENINVFPAGVYIGKHKPNDVEEYLGPFVDEVIELKEKGLEIKGKTLLFKIRALVFDAPAKSFACGIAHHSSANGCSKCTQVAKKIKFRLVYSSQIGQIIEDVDFSDRKYKAQHQLKFLNKQLPFEKVGLKMIQQVPLDPMHLIDLGVTRKMLRNLFTNKVEKKNSSQQKQTISKILYSFRKYITNDFNRLPRSFDEISHWKATEFRQFLLYTGIAVLKDNVSEDFYYMFLLLHSAVRLLSCPRTFEKNIEIAKKMLNLFVENFSTVFGQDSVSYNVHGLLHIGACVKEHGALYNFSAYDFENYMQTLKKDVRKPTKVLQQLFIRNSHSNILKMSIRLGFQIKNQTIYSYRTKEYTLSINSPNNICSIIPYAPFKILAFKLGEKGEQRIIGKFYRNIQPFFNEPLNSLEALGISIGTNLLDENVSEFSVEDIDCKLLSLPYNNQLIFLPILHGCTNSSN